MRVSLTIAAFLLAAFTALTLTVSGQSQPQEERLDQPERPVLELPEPAGPRTIEAAPEIRDFRLPPAVDRRLDRRNREEDRPTPRPNRVQPQLGPQPVNLTNPKYHQLKPLKPVTIEWPEVKKVIDRRAILSPEAVKNMARQKLPQPVQPTLSTKSVVLAQAIDKYMIQAKEVEAPVLLPMKALDAKQTHLVTGKNFFDFQAAFEKNNITMVGMCQTAEVPQSSDIQAALARRRAREATDTEKRLKTLDTPYQISAQHSGFGLRFSKFGCAYKLDCDSCETEEELLEMTKEMGVINAK